jgi:sugar phosphate isomerase/epimerase
MSDQLNRRGFVGAGVSGALAMGAGVVGGVGAVPALAMKPIKRSGPARMKLSLAAYSMRKFLVAKEGEPYRMTMLDFVDFAAQLDLDAIEPTSYFFPEEVTKEYLATLKRKCHVNGLDISSGAIRNVFTLPAGKELESWFHHLEIWLDHYAAIDCPVIRIFAGKAPKGVSEQQAIANAIPNIRRACKMAGRRGIMLGLENHDFLVKYDRIMPIIEAVESPWFCVNLDSGNFHSKDPYEDFRRVAPYAGTVQIKTGIRPEGGDKQPADLSRLIGSLKDVNYRGYVVLEYEDAEDPYVAIPRYLKELRELIS